MKHIHFAVILIVLLRAPSSRHAFKSSSVKSSKVPLNTIVYINLEWSRYMEAVTQSDITRDLYLIVIMTSLMSTKVEVFKQYTHMMQPLDDFLLAHDLLPKDDKHDNKKPVLDAWKNYRPLIDDFLRDFENCRFDDIRVIIPEPLRDILQPMKPKCLYGEVVDRFAIAYVSDWAKDGVSTADQYQRKAEFLVSIMPRFKTILNYINSQRGGDIHAAIDFDRRKSPPSNGIVDYSQIDDGSKVVALKKQSHFISITIIIGLMFFVVIGIIFVIHPQTKVAKSEAQQPKATLESV